MEFVGRTVRKEFKGFGVFSGVVKSYDSSSGFFEIGYEDGDSEEIDFSELAALLELDGVIMEHSPSLLAKQSSRVGKRPKKRRRVLCSSISGNENEFSSSLGNAAVVDDSNLDSVEGELVSEVNIVNNVTKKLGISSNDNNDVGSNCENLTFKDVGLNVNSRVHDLDQNGKGNADEIKLNSDLDDENDPESKLKDLVDDSVKKEQILDLNMDLDYSQNKNQDIDLGGYVKGENSGGNETMNTSSTDVSLDLDPHGNLGSGKTRGQKRRKLTDSPKVAAESVLRRSARRQAKLSREDHEPNPIKFEGDESTLPLPSPVISAVSEDEPAISASEESEERVALPSKLELPPSTGNMNLDGLPVVDLFSVYTFLRSFSTILFLSPFEFGDFVASVRSKSPSLLIDSIHVSLLRTLRKHLEFQSSENSTSASNCLRDLNWDLLDSITWPIFMVEYLLMKPEFDLGHLKPFKDNYYNQSESLKLKILHFICDDMVESEATTSELNMRSMGIEYNDFGQPTKLIAIKKQHTPMAISGGCEEVIDEGTDRNSDECCLCKMDGNLICCDGCPAAFHSKCVGVASSLLPAGDWFCPECVVDKKNRGFNMAKAIRGGELLGVDPYGRMYYSACGYILVSEDHDAETSFHYYDIKDVTSLIHALELSDGPYEAISTAITNHLHSYEKLHGATFPSESPNDDNTLTIKTLSLKTESEIGYVNLYSFARVASSVVGEWTRKPSDNKTPQSQTPSKSLEELISIQMKTISKTPVDFFWSNIRNLSPDARKEKCGWCLACQFPTDDGNCLFYANNALFLENFKSDVLGFDSVSRKDRLIDAMCHILCIEDRLHGLLLGPWLNPHFPKLYRKKFIEASDIGPVKQLLLMLELNIRGRVVSDEWVKHVDSVATVGSASHIVTSKPRVPSRKTIGRKNQSELLDSEPHSSKNTASGLGLFWWRGGKLTRKLFSWKLLPRSLASKSARQGGGKKIEGILYPENSDFPKRGKVVAWRASVESAVTVEQLAYQIRELDANIKWEEIENTIHVAKMDKDSLKYMRSFKKAIVRRKSTENGIVKYLLDFGKRRFIPDTVVKHGSKLEESSSERKKYWVEESHVPLFLLKGFEDKRIALKSNKMSLNKLSIPSTGKVSKKDVFSYLFSKAETSQTRPCGHCNKDVTIRDAVSCQYCEGYFHKTHVKKTSGGKGAYTCHNCHVGDTVNISGTAKKKKRLKSRKTKKPSPKITEKTGKCVVPLRRSTRKPKIVSIQSKKKTVKRKKPGKKKKQLKLIDDAVKVKSKGRRGRPKKITKESFRKKRSQVYATYWLHGLLLSRKPDDERVVDFRARNHIPVPPFDSNSVGDQRKCCLCQEPEFRPLLSYVSCVTCTDWYHGDAFGLKDEHMGVIIGFKCHKCRERAPPVCPHQSVMCDEDKGVLGKESFVTDNIVNGLNTGFGDSMEGVVVQEDGIAK
ncbi:hypothetical protein LXL04_003588 [Taraxacum kok-saghyz]